MISSKFKLKKYLAVVVLMFNSMVLFTCCKHAASVENLPEVVTSEVRDIKFNSAVSGGDIISDGGLFVTAKGVCWSTNTNPTINDNKTVDGAGAGAFVSQLKNLVYNTTYYVRAYATNDAGTSYGSIYVFETEEYPYSHDGDINGHGYVDLGLSVKWATCNIGANNPEEYGGYYAWGETKTKELYTDENSVTYGKHIGDISGNAKYDAATANWGGSWRIPTYEEVNEIMYMCTWEWTDLNGIKGYKVTGWNGNHIFLPATGYRDGSSLYNVCYGGNYWSSKPKENILSGAYRLGLNVGNVGHNVGYGFLSVDFYNRSYGYSIRPVTE